MLIVIPVVLIDGYQILCRVCGHDAWTNDTFKGGICDNVLSRDKCPTCGGTGGDYTEHRCTHGYTYSHSYCEHGNTSSHYTGNCPHGNSYSHVVKCSHNQSGSHVVNCSHGKASQHDD